MGLSKIDLLRAILWLFVRSGLEVFLVGLVRRQLVDMYHRVGAKYLQEYLDEFAFWCSHRHEGTRANRFDVT